MATPEFPFNLVLDALRGNLAARRDASHQLARALREGDSAATVLASAALLLTTLLADDVYTGWQEATQAVRQQLGVRPPQADTAMLLLADVGEMVARWYASGLDPSLPVLTDDVLRALADQRIAADLRAAAGMATLTCQHHGMDAARVRQVASAMQPVLADPGLSPALAQAWQQALVLALQRHGDSSASQALRQAQQQDPALAPALALKYHLADATLALDSLQTEAARLALQKAEPLLQPHAPMLSAQWHFLSSRLAVLDGKFTPALSHARLCQELALQACFPERWTAPFVMQEGQVQVARGFYMEAAPHFTRAAALSAGVTADQGQCMAHFARALGLAAAARDDSPARAELAAGWDVAQHLRWAGFFKSLPKVAARLCGMALEAGIETDFVRRAIALRKLPPPDPHQAVWPWPVRLLTLGQWQVEVDGRVLQLSGRMARKPLELLQHLAAAGSGEASAATLCSALWPGVASAVARQHLSRAARALQRLLRHPEAVLLQGDKVALGAQFIWVDARAFEALTEAAVAQSAGTVPAKRALALYGGHFLPGPGGAAWLLAARTRLAGKFRRVAAVQAHQAQRSGDLPQALAVLERAVELDPLAEDLVRELMQLYSARGERAQALALFERCRTKLAAVLGATPSPATVRLAAGLR